MLQITQLQLLMQALSFCIFQHIGRQEKCVGSGTFTLDQLETNIDYALTIVLAFSPIVKQLGSLLTNAMTVD